MDPRKADGRRTDRAIRRLLLLSGALVVSTFAAARGDDRASNASPGFDAEVRYNGTPAPGARIVVGANGPAATGTVYRWVQTEGPPVAIDDPGKPQISFIVPPNAQRLVFLLTLKDGNGQRAGRVVIPINSAPDRASLRAEAGDDQIGLVGRQITLNGSASTPRERLGYRWLQVAGPKLGLAVGDQAYFSFTPVAPGVYRFALVVAEGSRISEPDEVTVTVGDYPAKSASDPGVSLAGTAPSPGLSQAVLGAESFAPKALIAQVADVFQAVSERAALYSTFAELTSEMTRRLDGIVPADPNSRQLWAQNVFAPLTQHTTAEMFAMGVDLRFPQNHQQPLNASQKEKLRNLFHTYSLEFRSRTQAR